MKKFVEYKNSGVKRIIENQLRELANDIETTFTHDNYESAYLQQVIEKVMADRGISPIPSPTLPHHSELRGYLSQ